MLLLRLTVAWSWFFLLLWSYYILKPLRDGVASELAKELDQWYFATFTGIVIAMAVYTRLVAWLSTQLLVIAVYQFFSIWILLLAVIVGQEKIPQWCIGPFFVWVSVFNVCSVAVFWSVVTDLLDKKEAKEWFGVLAGAGSVGAIAGSTFTIWGTQSLTLGQRGLLLASLAGMQLTQILAWCFIWLSHRSRSTAPDQRSSPGESRSLSLEPLSQTPLPAENPTLWNGVQRVFRNRYLLAICIFVLFAKFVATYIYNNLQLGMQVEMKDVNQRTGLFASMNVATQIGSAVFQYLLVGLMIRFFGVRTVLAIPVMVMLGVFGVLAWKSSLTVLVVAQVVQQILGYGIVSPAQNILFTVVPRQDKYVAKGFIDTFVFRLSDFLSSKGVTLLRATQWSLATISLAMIPLLGAWLWVSLWLGRRHREMERENPK